jgi:glyoxalase family protein
MSASFAPTGIDHVALQARDLDQTVRFYMEVLGLRVLDSPPANGASTPDRVWLGDDRRAFISISRAIEDAPGKVGIGIIHHVALAAPSLDALLKWKRWLQDREILVYGPYDQQAYQDLVFTDPDGVLLEIATQGPGWEGTRDGEDVYSPPKTSMAPYRDEEIISARIWRQPVTSIEPDMALQGVHHVAIITSALERTDAFYRDTLGLPLVRKTIDSDDSEVERWYWGLDGGRPGTLVAAFPIVHAHGGGREVHGISGPGIVLHYALGLEGPDLLQERVSTLSQHGIDATPAVDEMGRPAACLRDPDGQVIELVATGAPSGDTEPAGALQVEQGAGTTEARPGSAR